MKIVFCTTCRGRLDHLKQTLPRNLADNPDALFVVLDYASSDGLSEYLLTGHAPEIDAARLIVYRYDTEAPFHLAHAKNLAARCAILEGADVLITQDADNFTGPGFAAFVASQLKGGDFLCPDFPYIKSLPHGEGRPQRGYAGRLAIRAQDFIKAGGYDEIYDTWRGEDTDMICRLERMGYVQRTIDIQYLETIPHNSKIRFREYPHAKRFESNGEYRTITARTETVVNSGRFGLGRVWRNYEDPIKLSAIPTRIFGIGMHKTATTSLHEAFKILGLDSLHWGEGEAPAIWGEVNARGRSKTLERWYALSDLPIPLLFRRLDQAYPGAKFILTTRNERDWLKSVERLYSYEYNPTRWTWDAYPFSNRIHTVLYGRKDFDAPTCLARYRRHNAEVREYFEDRPQDLLVMDMDGGGDWHELCDFIKQPVPAVAFPRQNVSRVLHPVES